MNANATVTRLGLEPELTTRGRTITEADVVSFAALTGDFHPQHSDAEWAARSRFGERVAHGMLVISFAVGLMPFDPERVVALRGLDSVTFKRPARIGDTIRVRSRVEGVRELGADQALVTLGWRIVNQDDATIARARVEALWRVAPEREEAAERREAAERQEAPEREGAAGRRAAAGRQGAEDRREEAEDGPVSLDGERVLL